jgi:hypothetical protein
MMRLRPTGSCGLRCGPAVSWAAGWVLARTVVSARLTQSICLTSSRTAVEEVPRGRCQQGDETRHCLDQRCQDDRNPPSELTGL